MDTTGRRERESRGEKCSRKRNNAPPHTHKWLKLSVFDKRNFGVKKFYELTTARLILK